MIVQLLKISQVQDLSGTTTEAKSLIFFQRNAFLPM